LEREGQHAGRRTLKETASSKEDETSSKGGVDGGRRETARARVKTRGRGGSGEPNNPAIRPQTRLQGAPNSTRGSAFRGQPAARDGRRGWNLRRGSCSGRAFGSLGTLEGHGAARLRAPRIRLLGETSAGRWAWGSGLAPSGASLVQVRVPGPGITFRAWGLVRRRRFERAVCPPKP